MLLFLDAVLLYRLERVRGRHVLRVAHVARACDIAKGPAHSEASTGRRKAAGHSSEEGRWRCWLVGLLGEDQALQFGCRRHGISLAAGQHAIPRQS